MFRTIFVENVNENQKFEFFEKKSGKNRNFEIFDFHWLFQRFFLSFFFISKNSFRFLFAKNFRRKIFDEKKIGSPISRQNFPKIPKITLRQISEHSRRLYRLSYFFLTKFALDPPYGDSPGEILWFSTNLVTVRSLTFI